MPRQILDLPRRVHDELPAERDEPDVEDVAKAVCAKLRESTCCPNSVYVHGYTTGQAIEFRGRFEPLGDPTRHCLETRRPMVQELDEDGARPERDGEEGSIEHVDVLQ